MKEIEDNLDLLDLDEDTGLDLLPPASPFERPRPKKPWLLLGVGVLVIILATYIIIRVIGSDPNSSMEVNLDVPEVVSVDVTTEAVMPVPDDIVVAVPAQVAPAVKPVVPAEPKTETVTPGVPVRQVADRKEVSFNPKKADTVPAAKIKPAVKPAPVKAAAKTKPSVKPAPKSAWYVQFGSYSTRALAEIAQKQIQSGHASLLGDKQFVILAAVLPNGKTTYRLRVGFSTSTEANGFCRNAKSDGLDCYVAK